MQTGTKLKNFTNIRISAFMHDRCAVNKVLIEYTTGRERNKKPTCSQQLRILPLK